MLEIIICDDNVNELNTTSKMCRKYQAGYAEADLKISSCSSPLELKRNIEQGGKYDIYLLDIYMPEMMGTELAKFLRDRNQDCQIIFLTTSVSHAVEAFSLHAAHYLVKPFTQEQLEEAIDKAIKLIDKKNIAQITVKTSEGIQRISFSDLLYSETDGHMQQLHMADGKRLQVRVTSSELFALLAADIRFFKCGSTYIINVEKIEEISRNYIRFVTGETIPMMRRQYQDLIDRFTACALEGFS